MSTPLTLHTGRRVDGRPVLIAEGEIDMSNLAVFRTALDDICALSSPTVVDLTAVDYLDSGAINALFVHAETLHLICKPVLLSALRVCGLADLATIEIPGDHT